MQKHLYFICPTDHLESIINSSFEYESYFITSLGNSIEFDKEMVTGINELIDLEEIISIYFVLSQNNRVLLEGMNIETDNSVGLRNLHKKIKRQMKYSEELWNTCNHQFITLSYHLNDKIKELRSGLNSLRMNIPTMRGMIYSRDTEKFSSIYSDLLFENNVSIN